MKDSIYIKRKLDHLKRCGITADLDPVNNAVRPEWIKAEQEERLKRAFQAQNKQLWLQDAE